MLDALTQWLIHERERVALGLSRSDQYDELAKDLGVSINELSYLLKSAPDPLQLPDMLKALGINEDALRRAQPALLRAMEAACAQCVVLGRCQHEFARGTAAGAYQKFCPNADKLAGIVSGN